MKYGELPTPEEHQHIEVITDPIRTVRALHEVFAKIPNQSMDKMAYWVGAGQGEAARLYSEGLKLLEGRKINITGSQLVDALRDVASKDKWTGIFMSLVHNETSLEELCISDYPELDAVGYKLKPGKLLILDNVKALAAGEEAEGDILNWGALWIFAENAKAGIQAKWGTSTSYGMNATGGVQLNYGLTQGLQTTGDWVGYAKGGVQVDWNVRKRQVRVASDVYNRYGKPFEGVPKVIYGKPEHKVELIILGRKVEPASFAPMRKQLLQLGRLRKAQPKDAVKIIKQLRAFDWDSFKADFDKGCEGSQ